MSPDPLLAGVVWGQEYLSPVTDVLPVEAFVTEIKLESSDQ